MSIYIDGLRAQKKRLEAQLKTETEHYKRTQDEQDYRRMVWARRDLQSVKDAIYFAGQAEERREG